MMEAIKQLLSKTATEKQVKILYACETGSRAWGFPSPDSDYDIRFIYMHKMDWYLSLGQKKDTIEFMDGEFDITGWDLRKCLALLKKSNVPLIERFQSPVEYYGSQDFITQFKELIENYYSPTAVFFHHYSLAVKFWGELKDENEFKLKSCFYLIRSLLSCNWIIRDKTVLPMHIEGLMKYVEDEWRNYLRDLIVLKSGVGEKYLHPKDEKLVFFISNLFEYIELNKNHLGVNSQEIGLLDDFFLKMLYGKVDN
jgi:uncharacterized protein